MSGVKKMHHILLSGAPGVGKTTIVREFCNVLKEKNVKIVGFYTVEVLNETGKRIGFDVVTLDGKRGRLARTSDAIGPKDRSKFKLGNYQIFLEEFEMIVLPIISIRWMENVIFVVDEIGKMEMLSVEFVKLVTDLFTVPNIHILATIPTPRLIHLPLVEQLRTDPNNRVIDISVNNRHKVLTHILQEMNFV